MSTVPVRGHWRIWCQHPSTSLSAWRVCLVSQRWGQPALHLVTDPHHPIRMPGAPASPRWADWETTAGGGVTRLQFRAVLFFFPAWDWWMGRKRRFRNILLHATYIWVSAYKCLLCVCVFVWVAVCAARINFSKMLNRKRHTGWYVRHIPKEMRYKVVTSNKVKTLHCYPMLHIHK